MAQARVGNQVVDLVGLATAMPGQDPVRQLAKTVNAAGLGKSVPSGSVDFLLGPTGKPGDYIKMLKYAVLASGSSQVVLRDGTTAPVYSINGGSVTPSTTTTINTVSNPVAVLANQFKDCLVKSGTEYRRVLAHPAFAAGVTNQFNVDRAFTTAPPGGTPINILDRNFAFEVVPFGKAAGDYEKTVEERATQNGWYISTGDGVLVRPSGDFT